MQQPILSEFNKEQEAFIAAKGGKAGEAHPPWVGYPQEEKLKEEIMSLSTVSSSIHFKLLAHKLTSCLIIISFIQKLLSGLSNSE